MRCLLLLLAVFVAFGSPREDYIEYSENVHDLTDDTFEDFVEKHENVMVKFYAPWCPHCQGLASAYSGAADIFASVTDEDAKVAFAIVNCDNEALLCTEFGILGFPTLKLFKNGDFFRDFEPGTTGKESDGIVRWLRGRVGDPTRKVETVDELLHFTSEVGALSILVAAFPGDSVSSVEVFRNVATELDDFIFVEVHDGSEELLGFLRLDSELSAVQLSLLPSYADFSPQNVVLGDETFSEASALLSVIRGEAYPLVDEVGAVSFKRFADSGLYVGILFVNTREDPAIELLNRVALQLREHAVFGFAMTTLYGAQLELMGGHLDEVPTLAFMDIPKQLNYPFGTLDRETVEGVAEWFDTLRNGEIQHFVRSDPVPSDEEQLASAPVHIVVANTYQEFVMEAERDVLIEFYAPWCQHCKALAPDYHALAEKFAPIQDVLLIAKIDGSSNDSPDPKVTIEGFPTLVFYPMGAENPIFYEGDRTPESLTAFLQDNVVAAKVRMEEILSPVEVVDESPPETDSVQTEVEVEVKVEMEEVEPEEL